MSPCATPRRPAASGCNASREGRALVTANVVDFVILAQRAVATNAEHDGIILVPSTFRGDEFQAIADGICDVLERFPRGLRGLVIYIQRTPRP